MPVLGRPPVSTHPRVPCSPPHNHGVRERSVAHKEVTVLITPQIRWKFASWHAIYLLMGFVCGFPVFFGFFCKTNSYLRSWYSGLWVVSPVNTPTSCVSGPVNSGRAVQEQPTQRTTNLSALPYPETLRYWGAEWPTKVVAEDRERDWRGRCVSWGNIQLIKCHNCWKTDITSSTLWMFMFESRIETANKGNQSKA